VKMVKMSFVKICPPLVAVQVEWNKKLCSFFC